MQRNEANLLSIFFLAIVIHFSISCTSKTKSQPDPKRLQYELSTIDSLLRDVDFTQSMAKYLDSSYYVGIGEVAPEFITQKENFGIVSKHLKDEKVATNLAGFYALECGIGLLSTQTNQTPVEWLQKIKNGSADSNTVLLLNRFANATWKASQPFRGLNRIARYNFTVANLLSESEVKKDFIQIENAASKLLTSLDKVSKNDLPLQMQAIRLLLQDTTYAIEMAAFLDSTYSLSQKQKPNTFLTFANDTATIKKSMKELKIATSIAGFYALECGLNYLVTTKKVLPSTILKSLVDGSINKEDKMVFARFANATWKAGQPFRDLKRITRKTFTPFYFLNEADIEKDMVQIQMAARKLLAYI